MTQNTVSTSNLVDGLIKFIKINTYYLFIFEPIPKSTLTESRSETSLFIVIFFYIRSGMLKRSWHAMRKDVEKRVALNYYDNFSVFIIMMMNKLLPQHMDMSIDMEYLCHIYLTLK